MRPTAAQTARAPDRANHRSPAPRSRPSTGRSPCPARRAALAQVPATGLPSPANRCTRPGHGPPSPRSSEPRCCLHAPASAPRSPVRAAPGMPWRGRCRSSAADCQVARSRWVRPRPAQPLPRLAGRRWRRERRRRDGVGSGVRAREDLRVDSRHVDGPTGARLVLQDESLGGPAETRGFRVTAQRGDRP